MLTLKDFKILITGSKSIDNTDIDQYTSNTAFTVGVRPYMVRRTLEDIIILCTLGMGFLAAAAYALLFTSGFNNPVENVYYPINNRGQVIQQYNLADKKHSNAQAQSFAMKAIRLSYNYNYTNWRYQFNRLAPMFNLKDWEQYEATMSKHNLIRSLKFNHLNIYSTITGAAKLTGSGVVNGHYMWRYKVPVTMHYTTKQYKGKQRLNVIVTVTQSNPYFYPYGLRVVSIAAMYQ